MHTNQFFSKNDENSSQFLLISRRESDKVPAPGQQFCLSRPAIRKKTLRERERERENPTSQRRTQNLDFERPQNNSPKSKNKEQQKQQQHALRYRKPRKKNLIKKSSKHRTKGRKESAARK
jgi:hypothetical protein